MLKRMFAAFLTVAVIFSTVIGVDTTLGKYTKTSYVDTFDMGLIGGSGLEFLAYNTLETDVQGVSGDFGTWSWTKTSDDSQAVVEFISKEDAIENDNPEFYGVRLNPGISVVDETTGDTIPGQVSLRYSFPEDDGYSSKLIDGHIYYVCFDSYHEESSGNDSGASRLHAANAYHYDESIFEEGQTPVISVFAASNVYQADKSQPGTKSWKKMSVLFNGSDLSTANTKLNTNDKYNQQPLAADKIDSIHFSPQSYSHGRGDHWLKDFIFIDLTENFGAGNEPSREWCDMYLDSRFGEEEKEINPVVKPLMTLRMTDPSTFDLNYGNSAYKLTKPVKHTNYNAETPFISFYKIYSAGPFGAVPSKEIDSELDRDEQINEIMTEYGIPDKIEYTPDRDKSSDGFTNDNRDYGYFFKDESLTDGFYTIIMFSNMSQNEVHTIPAEDAINPDTQEPYGTEMLETAADSQLNPDHMYYYALDVRAGATISIRPSNTFHYVPKQYDSEGNPKEETGLFYHSAFTDGEVEQYVIYNKDRTYQKASGIFSGGKTIQSSKKDMYGKPLDYVIPDGRIDSISIGIGSDKEGYAWVRNFVLVDLTEYFGDDIPSKWFCDKYFTIDALENGTLSVASLRMLREETEAEIELEEGMITGTQIDIVDMSTVKSSKNIAIDETPEGYEFYGWHIRSDFASMLLPIDEAELTLEEVYASVDGEPYPLTLTAIYKEKAEEPSPSPEPSPEPSVEASEEPSIEPSVEGVIGGGSDVSEETTPTPTETIEPTVSPSPTETIEPAPEPDPEPSETPDNVINIDASEVENLSISEVDETFIKGEDISLAFVPDEGYDIPDSIDLVIDGEEYRIMSGDESGFDNISFIYGVLTISKEITADISDLVIKASGVKVSAGGSGSPENTEEPSPEASQEPTEEPTEEPSQEPTPEPTEDTEEFTPADELLGNDIVVETPENKEDDAQDNETGTMIDVEGVETSNETEEVEPTVVKEVLVATIKKEEEAAEEEISEDEGSDEEPEIDSGSYGSEEASSGEDTTE